MYCLLFVLYFTACSGVQQHRYAIKSTLTSRELELALKANGLVLEGHNPLQNVYRVRSDGTYPELSQSSRKRRSVYEPTITENPKIHEIVYQPPLQIEKRVPITGPESVEIPRSVSRPVSIQHPNDSTYDAAYKLYAKQARSIYPFNDPVTGYAWQYLNDGSSISPAIGLDLNLYSAYISGLTGRGSNVVILDDAFDTRHPDLTNNYDEKLSGNLDRPEVNGLSPRGPQEVMDINDGHGTRCAGLIGSAANNGICSHGVAFNTRLGGLRYITDHTTDAMGAEALTHKLKDANIYCSSWGPIDNGILMDRPKRYTEEALGQGLRLGRGGRGALYVFAAGNGGTSGDSCGADGYVNTPGVLTVAAIDHLGRIPFFAESCSAIRFAVAIGGSSIYDVMPTTSENSQCESNFQGTSAAAPLAAGCLALVLESNPNISLRQIENILPWAARIPSPEPRPPLEPNSPTWQVNAAGILYHPYVGYGLLDCSRLARLASSWKASGQECIASSEVGQQFARSDWIRYQEKAPEGCEACKVSNSSKQLEEFVVKLATPTDEREPLLLHSPIYDIFSGDTTQIRFEIDPATNTENCRVEAIEHVLVDLQWIHACRGALKIVLRSPTGFSSLLLDNRPLDVFSGKGLMSFTSYGNWGEPIKGTWLLEITDSGKCGGPEQPMPRTAVVGKVYNAKLQLTGTSRQESAYTRNQGSLEPLLTRVGRSALKEQSKARVLTAEEIAATFDEQRWLALNESLAVIRKNTKKKPDH